MATLWFFPAVLTCLFLISAALNEPPTIISGPKATPTYFTQKLNLSCLARGSDPLTYTWLLNNNPLDMIRYKATHDANTGIFQIASGAPEGDYRCNVTNQFGVALTYTTTVRKTVLQADPSDATAQVTAILGSSLQIPCNTAGVSIVPRVDYYWETVSSRTSTAQGTRLILDTRVQTDDKGTLNFAYIVQSDNQNGNFYRCKLINVENNDIELSVSYTQITVNGPQANPTALQPLFTSVSATPALLGQNVKLRCFFSGGSTGNAVMITWVRSDGSNIVGSRFYDDRAGTLTIYNVVKEDEAEYTCTGSAGSSFTPATSKLKLTVESVPYFDVPFDGPVNTRGTVGRSVTINCSAKAIPSVNNLQWFRNGIPIISGALPPKMSLSSDERSLTISNLCQGCGDAGDLGVIQCIAANSHGYVLGQGYVNVFQPTQMKIKPKDIPLDYPNPVIFTCNATSDPQTPITYTWTLDDAPVLDGSLNTSVPGTLYIDIKNMQDKGEKFQGVWTCTASNGISSDFGSAKLGNPVVSGSAVVWKYWWIPFIVVLIVVLLLLLLLLICCCLYRNRGNQYPVDEKERKGGHDPVKELAEGGFHDYQRPADRVDGPTTIPETLAEPPRYENNTQGSINSSFARGASDDEMSLNDYSNINPGKFTEDGSFIGQYQQGSRRNRTVNNLPTVPYDSMA